MITDLEREALIDALEDWEFELNQSCWLLNVFDFITLVLVMVVLMRLPVTDWITILCALLGGCVLASNDFRRKRIEDIKQRIAEIEARLCDANAEM